MSCIPLKIVCKGTNKAINVIKTALEIENYVVPTNLTNFFEV